MSFTLAALDHSASAFLKAVSSAARVSATVFVWQAVESDNNATNVQVVMTNNVLDIRNLGSGVGRARKPYV